MGLSREDSAQKVEDFFLLECDGSCNVGQWAGRCRNSGDAVVPSNKLSWREIREIRADKSTDNQEYGAEARASRRESPLSHALAGNDSQECWGGKPSLVSHRKGAGAGRSFEGKFKCVDQCGIGLDLDTPRSEARFVHSRRMAGVCGEVRLSSNAPVAVRGFGLDSHGRKQGKRVPITVWGNDEALIRELASALLRYQGKLHGGSRGLGGERRRCSGGGHSTNRSAFGLGRERRDSSSLGSRGSRGSARREMHKRIEMHLKVAWSQLLVLQRWEKNTRDLAARWAVWLLKMVRRAAYRPRSLQLLLFTVVSATLPRISGSVQEFLGGPSCPMSNELLQTADTFLKAVDKSGACFSPPQWDLLREYSADCRTLLRMASVASQPPALMEPPVQEGQEGGNGGSAPPLGGRFRPMDSDTSARNDKEETLPEVSRSNNRGLNLGTGTGGVQCTVYQEVAGLRTEGPVHLGNSELSPELPAGNTSKHACRLHEPSTWPLQVADRTPANYADLDGKVDKVSTEASLLEKLVRDSLEASGQAPAQPMAEHQVQRCDWKGSQERDAERDCSLRDRGAGCGQHHQPEWREASMREIGSGGWEDVKAADVPQELLPDLGRDALFSTELLHEGVPELVKRAIIEKVKDSYPGHARWRPVNNTFAGEQSLQVSLLCPISGRRLKVPTRGSSCKHQAAFDLEAHLQAQAHAAAAGLHRHQRAATWLCPICRGSATWPQLEVDAFLLRILSSLPDEVVTAVVVWPETRWYAGTMPPRHSFGPIEHRKRLVDTGLGCNKAGLEPRTEEQCDGVVSPRFEQNKGLGKRPRPGEEINGMAWRVGSGVRVCLERSSVAQRLQEEVGDDIPNERSPQGEAACVRGPSGTHWDTCRQDNGGQSFLVDHNNFLPRQQVGHHRHPGRAPAGVLLEDGVLNGGPTTVGRHGEHAADHSLPVHSSPDVHQRVVAALSYSLYAAHSPWRTGREESGGWTGGARQGGSEAEMPGHREGGRGEPSIDKPQERAVNYGEGTWHGRGKPGAWSRDGIDGRGNEPLPGIHAPFVAVVVPGNELNGGKRISCKVSGGVSQAAHTHTKPKGRGWGPAEWKAVAQGLLSTNEAGVERSWALAHSWSCEADGGIAPQAANVMLAEGAMDKPEDVHQQVKPKARMKQMARKV